MALNKYLDIAPEVQKALDEGRPVVALEIHHHLPRHALSPECGDRPERGEDHPGTTAPCPATIAIIGGRLKAGLTPEEIDYLGKSGHCRDQGQPPGSARAGG